MKRAKIKTDTRRRDMTEQEANLWRKNLVDRDRQQIRYYDTETKKQYYLIEEVFGELTMEEHLLIRAMLTLADDDFAFIAAHRGELGGRLRALDALRPPEDLPAGWTLPYKKLRQV